MQPVKYTSAVGNRIGIRSVLESGLEYVGESIICCGWVKTIRLQAKRAFISLNDGSCYGSLQCVVDQSAPGFEGLKAASTGASIKVVGKVTDSPAKGQLVELVIESANHYVEVLGTADATKYPIAKSSLGEEFIRTLPHLRPRTNLIGCVTRVRNTLARVTHEFFQARDFLYITTPLITASDCEGAGEMFEVSTKLKSMIGGEKYVPADDFFGGPVNLTVSGQLAVEPFAISMSQVYTFGPTFRAEKSHSSRHLAEFWMIEPEIAFADCRDVMDLAEDFIKCCIEGVLRAHQDDLKYIEGNVEKVDKNLRDNLGAVIAEPFARCSYVEALTHLQEAVAKGVKFEPEVDLFFGVDFVSEHEKYLCSEVFKKPVFVFDYPQSIKSFYMKLNPPWPNGEQTVAAFDLLFPGVGELAGGSQREEDLDKLKGALALNNLKEEDYKEYLDIRRYGTVVHGGFGVGFERLVMLATGMGNIRDVIPYPRYPGYCEG